MDIHQHEQLSRWLFPSLLLHLLLIFLFMNLQHEQQEPAYVIFTEDQEQVVSMPMPALPQQPSNQPAPLPDKDEEVLFNINLAKSSTFGMTSFVSEETKLAGNPQATEDSAETQTDPAEQTSETPAQEEQKVAEPTNEKIMATAALVDIPTPTKTQAKADQSEKKNTNPPTSTPAKKRERNFWGQAAQSSSPVAKNMSLTKLAEGFLNYAKETSSSTVDINSQDLNLAPTLQRIGWFLQNSFHLHNKPISLDRDVHTSINLHLELDEKGALLNCYLSPQTNVLALDRNLLRIAQGAAPFPPIPKHVMRNKQTFSVKIPIQIDAKRGTHEYYFIFRG